eukprot:scaffold2959_cov107-Isochrysis_galbana.AAC.4
MAPRQLRLEPIEVDTSSDKGSKRVRPDNSNEHSTQVLNREPERWPVALPGSALCALPVLP